MELIDQIFDIQSNEDFEKVALEVYSFQKDNCTVKSTPTGRPKQQEIQNEVYGKPRLQTWVRDLRKDLIANTMFTAPEAGCKKCCAK